MLLFKLKKLNNYQKITISLVLAILVVGLLISIPLLFNGEENFSQANESKGLSTDKIEPELPIQIEILCVGDIMVHEPQIASQYNAETNKYDYNNNFKYVKKYIEKADLSLGNFEGTFGGPPYKGYPAFSSPDEMAEALDVAGFDVIITANNHMVDRGKDGVLRTLQVLKSQGIETSGSRTDKEAPRYSISIVNGVKVAVVAYTYETSGSGTDISINGSYITAETAALINSFSYNRLDADLEKIRKTVEEAQSEGAQIIVLYLHWGEEYKTIPNEWQENIVEKVTERMPVNIIFASHPHVLQKMKMEYSQSIGKQIPVFYSMGNFISNQRDETLQNRFTEQGIMARVNIKYMESTNELVDISMDAIPTWVDRYKRDGKTVYEIVPLDSEFLGNPALIESGHLPRAKQALEDINGILEIN